MPPLLTGLREWTPLTQLPWLFHHILTSSFLHALFRRLPGLCVVGRGIWVKSPYIKKGLLTSAPETICSDVKSGFIFLFELQSWRYSVMKGLYAALAPPKHCGIFLLTTLPICRGSRCAAGWVNHLCGTSLHGQPRAENHMHMLNSHSVCSSHNADLGQKLYMLRQKQCSSMGRVEIQDEAPFSHAQLSSLPATGCSWL